MEGYSRKDEGCPQLLDLMIPNDTKWVKSEQTKHGLSEEKKLELRLAPPGEENWTTSREREHEHLLSYGYFTNNTTTCAQKWQNHQATKVPFLHLQSAHHHSVVKESNQKNKAAGELQQQQSGAEKKKAFSPNTAVAQKRTAPAPVVGWPPIRSFRKNLASGGSSKSTSESQDVAPNKAAAQKPVENCPKGLFVKINMDGIPIGRKVDLKAYDSYEKLASAVDELFRGLLAAQSDSSANGIKDKEIGGKAIGGLLDGSGEYTLVYEDNEGDRMLVGDVPWHMFISTVKRLRVLKSSELPMLSCGGKQGKVSLN